MRVEANAKLNLTLDVLGRRPDGYHDMRMIMQSVELADLLDITRSGSGELRVSTNLHFLPNNAKNLAAQAALRWWEAQGSSDAAAVLRALNELEGAGLSPAQLARIGERVGSDVPYCVTGGTALAEGRGEVLTPLPPLPPCWVVLCKPEFSISTPALFAKIDSVKLRCRPDTQGVIAALEARDLVGVARRMYNVFEDALPERQRSRVNDIKNVLIQCGALGASMSGTGPTAFGLFDSEALAREAQERLTGVGGEVFLTRTV